jgi:hypothetical protein
MYSMYVLYSPYVLYGRTLDVVRNDAYISSVNEALLQCYVSYCIVRSTEYITPYQLFRFRERKRDGDGYYVAIRDWGSGRMKQKHDTMMQDGSVQWGTVHTCIHGSTTLYAHTLQHGDVSVLYLRTPTDGAPPYGDIPFQVGGFACSSSFEPLQHHVRFKAFLPPSIIINTVPLRPPFHYSLLPSLTSIIPFSLLNPSLPRWYLLPPFLSCGHLHCALSYSSTYFPPLWRLETERRQRSSERDAHHHKEKTSLGPNHSSLSPVLLR